MRSRFRKLTIGVILSVVAVSYVIAVPESASAQSNYRVCGVWNTTDAPGVGYGTGLAVKVYKKGNSTCNDKIAFMANNYSAAYRGSFAAQHFEMETCETFAARTGLEGDPCDSMEVNGIYKYSSQFDLKYPTAAPTVSWWHK